ncbi:MAG: hypothetical protein ACKO1L_12235, partial [Brachymonas sp.]
VSAIAVLGSAAAAAQEQGRVISTTPVIQQVAVPRQVCTTEQVSTTSQGNKSGGGALIGGVAGGAVGNAIGKGNGRAAATAIGIFGGAILGNHLEGGKPETSTQNVQRCTQQTFYENKTTAYNVVYEFNGKQYQVQMPQDPGPFVQLSVTPVSNPAPVQVQPAPVIVRPITQAPVHTPPVIVESSTVYIQQPPVVYVRPAPVVYAPPVVYARPHPHSHLHPHLQPQHLAYPAVHYRQPSLGNVVSIGYTGYYR